MSKRPVIFLAFANEKEQAARYLRGLAIEQRKLKAALEPAVDAGLCELVVESNATLESIINTFQKARYRDRIAVFHYGGHADGYQLLLETANDNNEIAHGAGLVSFLGGQKGLRFIFLNGCSTQQQSLELLKAGIPAVIGTSNSIADNIATQLGARFYSSIGQGNNLARAWKEAQDEIKIRSGASTDLRSLYFGDEDDTQVQADRFPWDIYYREGSEIVKKWNLPDAGNNPLFGLPDIPGSYEYPQSPFRFLKRYTRDDSRVFFGRSSSIQSLYKQVTDPNASPLLLFHGQSGAGKSSLLDSGLLPRIEDSHVVIYLRRDVNKGLLGTLQEGLGVASRELNLQQLKSMSHEFDTSEQEELQRFIQLLSQKKEASPAPVTFSEEELEGFHQAKNLLPVWLKIEEKTGKPMILILDQVEEMYTRPQGKKLNSPFAENDAQLSEDEFNLFLAALQKLLNTKNGSFKGKLILAYRKEYHPEIEERLKNAEIHRSTIFLEHLHAKNIEEIIQVYGQRPALKKAYNLKIEEGLPELIAKDLSSNPDSPVAPVLQIILSRMWQMALKENPEEPIFKHAYYKQLLSEGIELRDFFLKQLEVMRSMKKQLGEVVDSGLALDLLKFHVTELGTAGSQKMEKIRDRYQDHMEEIEELVSRCEDLSLLASLDDAEQTMLAHDTLAPIVEFEYNESDKPAQRASRILSAKLMDLNALEKQADTEWEKEALKEKVFLDEVDLGVVESGMKHMRSLQTGELELIQRSQKIRNKKRAEKKRNRLIQIGSGIALILGAVIFAFFQRYNAQVILEANTVRVERNIERANEAIHRLRYPIALEFLEESASMKLNVEQTLSGLNELAFVYQQIGRSDSVFKILDLAEPLLEGSNSDEFSRHLNLARNNPSDSLLQLSRLHLSSTEKEKLLAEKYFPITLPVEGGEFFMGTDEPVRDEEDAQPRHKVAVSDFEMGKFEITAAQFHLFGMLTDSMPTMPSSDWLADHPMVAINWNLASAYCKWLSIKTGERYRLPTEAEWEYAASGGKLSKGYLYSGSNKIGEVAHYKKNSNFTSAVGQKAANELGLYDMSGNVKEWCYDYYAPYSGTFQENPTGPNENEINGTAFVINRGGGWSQEVSQSRKTFRLYNLVTYKDVVLGFRVVKEIQK